MGLLGWLKKQLKKARKAAKKAAKAVETAINKIGDEVDQAVESLGNALSAGLIWLGGHLPGIAGNALIWAAGIVRGVFAVVGAVLKSIFDITGALIGGAILIAGGTIFIDLGMVSKGFADMFKQIVGSVFLILSVVLVVLVQEVLGQGFFERGLNEKEIAQLKRVYEDSLNYFVIRIVPTKILFSGLAPSGNAFTLGNTIYLNLNHSDAVLKNIDLLVHECCHVWQYQNVAISYAFEAVYARAIVPDEYNWIREIKVRGKTDWREFYKEAQAQFLQDLWNVGMDKNGLATGNFYDDINTGTFQVLHFPPAREVSFPQIPPPTGGIVDDFTDFARTTVVTVRNGWSTAQLNI